MSGDTSRVMLITGASGGIGLATAQTFARHGWRVLAASRQPEYLASEPGVQPIQLDPCSEADRTRLRTIIATDFEGRLDCLVNNAGYCQSGPLELLSEAAWRAQLEVNLIAPALLTAALLPALRAAGGTVINVSSVLGRHAYPFQAAYAASKFGLEGWSEALMLESQGQDVRVHVVEPGATRSRFGQHMQSPPTEHSPYHQAGERFQAIRSRLAAKAQPATDVANAIFAAASRPTSPFRIPVGRDARAIRWLSRLLPDSLYLRVSRRLARKLFGLDSAQTSR